MPQSLENPRYLSSAEACDCIGIDRSTLSRWIKCGDAVPFMRLPGDTGAYLFAPDEVERLRIQYAAKTEVAS